MAPSLALSDPSDSNEVRPGTYLTVDYSEPGQIETFDAGGRLLWRYQPTGSSALNHPSLALPLPNGDVIATDDHNDRVIVVDPKTNAIVWQYGVRGEPGDGPGAPQRSGRTRHGAAVLRSRRPRRNPGSPSSSDSVDTYSHHAIKTSVRNFARGTTKG